MRAIDWFALRTSSFITGEERHFPNWIERSITGSLTRIARSLNPSGASRGDLIVTFLALLEMIRLKLVRIFQSGSFGPIRVYKRARPADAPHPIKDPEDVHAAYLQDERARAAKPLQPPE